LLPLIFPKEKNNIISSIIRDTGLKKAPGLFNNTNLNKEIERVKIIRNLRKNSFLSCPQFTLKLHIIMNKTGMAINTKFELGIISKISQKILKI